MNKKIKRPKSPVRQVMDNFMDQGDRVRNANRKMFAEWEKVINDKNKSERIRGEKI